MKNPHDIIVQPHITEKSVRLSYGDDRGAQIRVRREAKAAGEKNPGAAKVTDADVVRKYTFIVSPDANKIEIKSAIESIYNEGKKADEAIEVTSVRTIKVLGKKRRRGRSIGFEPDRKKAIVTLKQGQMLEDYGV